MGKGRVELTKKKLTKLEGEGMENGKGEDWREERRETKGEEKRKIILKTVIIKIFLFLFPMTMMLVYFYYLALIELFVGQFRSGLHSFFLHTERVGSGKLLHLVSDYIIAIQSMLMTMGPDTSRFIFGISLFPALQEHGGFS
jgi:hypothetical protein